MINLSVNITDVAVNAYNGTKYFSTMRVSMVEEVGELETSEVCTESVVVENDGRRRLVCSITRVLSYGQFHGCIICGVKLKGNGMSGIGEHGKCNMKLKLDRCQRKSSAKVMIKILGDKKVMKTMFNNVITQCLFMCDREGDSDGEVSLLNVINSQNVV